MITGVNSMVGRNQRIMLTDSIFKRRGAPKTVKAVMVAIEHPSMPLKCSNHQCIFCVGFFNQ